MPLPVPNGETISTGLPYSRPLGKNPVGSPLPGDSSSVRHPAGIGRRVQTAGGEREMTLIHSAFATTPLTFWREARFDAAYPANPVRIARDLDARESIKCAVDVRGVR